MRSLSGVKAPEKPADPIIVHPAVRALLLTQKCIAEGGRAMVFDCALLGDREVEAQVDQHRIGDLDELNGTGVAVTLTG